LTQADLNFYKVNTMKDHSNYAAPLVLVDKLRKLKADEREKAICI